MKDKVRIRIGWTLGGLGVVQFGALLRGGLALRDKRAGRSLLHTTEED